MVVAAANPCAKCGACTAVCPVFRSSGRESHSARGKLHLLDVLGAAEASGEFIDIFSACLLCGACAAVCPRGIDIREELIRARESFSLLSGPHGYEKYLTRKLLGVPKGLAGLRVLGTAGQKLFGNYLPQDSGLRLRLAMFSADHLSVVEEKKGDTGEQETGTGQELTWFPGCSSRYLYPEQLDACRHLFSQRGVELLLRDTLGCCGLADWAAGDREGAVKKAKKNIRILEQTSGSIMVSCASCLAQLQTYPQLFQDEEKWQQRAEKVALRLVEFGQCLHQYTTAVADNSNTQEEGIRIYYHTPCHLRYGEQYGDYGRQELLKHAGVELVDLAGGPRCCGQGGLFHVAQPEISARISDALVQDVLALTPHIVTSTCSGCLMQWQQGIAKSGKKVRVLHLSQLLNELRAV